MRKRNVIIVILLLSFIFSTAVRAKTVKYGYSDYIYKDINEFYTLYINGNNIKDSSSAVVEGNLVVPLRPVIETLGGSVTWNGKDKSITVKLSGTIANFKMNSDFCKVNGKKIAVGGKIVTIDGVSVVPVKFLYDIFNINVDINSEQQTLYINNSTYGQDVSGLNIIKYLNADSYFNLHISSNKEFDSEIFKVAKSGNLPNRIALKLFGINKKSGQEYIDVEGNKVERVRYTRYDKNVVGMALDLIGDPSYRYEKQKKSMDVYIGSIPLYIKKDNNMDNDQNVPEPDKSDDKKNTDESSNTDNSKNEDNINRKSITYKSDDNMSVLFLKGVLLEGGNYSMRKSTDELRFVLEIEKDAGIIKDDFLIIKDDKVKTVSTYYNRLAEHTTITIETPEKCKYTIKPVRSGDIGTKIIIRKEKIKGKWYNPGVKTKKTLNNITYYSYGDRISILLDGVQLTKGSEYITEYYTKTVSNGGKTLKIEFPGKYGKVFPSTVPVNDGKVKEITVRRNWLTGKTTIIINMTEPMVENIVYREDVDNTSITLLKPASYKDDLVVICAGHGGRSPGAISKGVYEKNINLDIALKAQQILESNGVNTYMIREDDSYIGLYERANIANKLNAKVFVSIHNNALSDFTVNGSMAFYHGLSYKGKLLSKLILNQLTKGLHTNNLGTREKSEFIVLKSTAMPSTLVEVAFLTGDLDFYSLISSYFRSQAGKEIAQGIMDYLGK